MGTYGRERASVTSVNLRESFLNYGIAYSYLGSTNERCEFNTLDLLKHFFFLRSLVEDILVLRLELFLLLFIQNFFLCRIYFAL